MPRRRCLRCPDTICGTDVDDMFAYSTTKMVRIRDARLGILHYVLMLLIVIYIVIVQLIALGGYLQKSPAMNTVRLTLQQPTRDPKTGKPCNPNKDSCDDFFTEPANLPYCWLKTRKTQGPFPTYNCSYMDGAEASINRGTQIMMTTAVHTYAQTRSKQCGTGSDQCKKLWDNSNDVVSYITDPDNFTLMVDHTLTSSALDTTNLHGYLYVGEGSARQDQLCAELEAVDSLWYGGSTNKAPCYVKPQSAEGKDFFTIRHWLQSAGVSLDDPSDEGKTTKRYDGLIVNVDVHYENFHLFHLGAESTAMYAYKLRVIPSTGYKDTKLVSTTWPGLREKEDLHGILFMVSATGDIMSFNFATMLIQLTTSLTLIAISTTLVNLIAQYILSNKTFYSRAMYQATHDFSDLRAANALTEDEIARQLTERGLTARGEKPDRILQLLDDGWEPPAPVASEVQDLQAAGVEQGRSPLVAAQISSSSR